MAAIGGPISSSSTVIQVEAYFKDNLSYRLNRDVDQAQAVVAACIWLTLDLPSSMGKGGAALSYNREFLMEHEKQATAYILGFTTSASDLPGGPRVTRVDFRGCR